MNYTRTPVGPIPSHLFDGLERYIKLHLRPGHFLQAVIANDLHEAVSRADAASLLMTTRLCKFLHNYVSSMCWGDREKLDAWCTAKGEQGYFLNAAADFDFKPNRCSQCSGHGWALTHAGIVDCVICVPQ
jgi:hypothetical protein